MNQKRSAATVDNHELRAHAEVLRDVLGDHPLPQRQREAVEFAVSLIESAGGRDAEWMPIETAPKDGTWIIGRTGFEFCPIVVAQWESEFEVWRSTESCGETLTHWIPLPAAPTTTGEAQG